MVVALYQQWEQYQALTLSCEKLLACLEPIPGDCIGSDRFSDSLGVVHSTAVKGKSNTLIRTGSFVPST